MQNKGCTRTVYYKPAFSGVYSNFNSFMTEESKHGLILIIIFWIFSIVFNFHEVSWSFIKFHEEVCYLKDVLKKKLFPTTSVDKCI